MLFLTDQNFDQEVTQEKTLPILIDFYADWCGPCKMMAPVIEELASQYEGKIKIAKLDVDKNQAVAAKFNVMSIPTLLFFKNGQVVNQLVGAIPKEQLKKELDNLIK